MERAIIRVVVLSVEDYVGGIDGKSLRATTLALTGNIVCRFVIQ